MRRHVGLRAGSMILIQTLNAQAVVDAINVKDIFSCCARTLLQDVVSPAR